MRKALGGLLLVALGVGCAVPIPCEKDIDCPTGGVCEPTLKFCVTGAGGGGVTGTCTGVSGQCQAWQTCQPTEDGGLCRDVTLALTSPDSGVVGAGGPFTLAGTVKQWDGGGFAGALPVRAPTGVNGSASLAAGGATGAFSGAYTAQVSGTYTLVLGWDAGVQLPVTVAALGCEHSGTCQAYQTCQPTLDGGVCRNVTLAVQGPAEGADFAAGSTVTLQATVTQWDGGAFGGQLPVAFPGFVSGSGTLAPSGGSYSGGYGLPANSGSYVLTAGWSGGPTVARTVGSLACDVARCAEWQECAPSRTGGACQSLLLNLTVAPVSPSTVGPNTLVQLRASMTRPDAGAVPASVPWTRPAPVAASGTLLAGNAYTANIDGGAPSGTYAFTVGWQDGGPVQQASYTVDATPPSFTVFVPPAPIYAGDAGTFWPNDPAGPAYRRDETINVEVWANDVDVDAGTVTLTAQFASDGLYTVPANVQGGCTVNAAKAYCLRFAVDVSLVPMQRFNGAVTFQARGADVLGNASAVASGTAQVTRWQWARQVDPAANSLWGSPAVDKTGKYWLTLNTATGGLVSVGADGTVGTPTADGQTDISPAIARNSAGTEFVFYEVTPTGLPGGAIKGAGAGCGLAGNNNATPHGSLAVLADNTSGAQAVGIVGSTMTQGRVAGLDTNGICSYSPAGTPVSMVGFPGNTGASGVSVFWGDSDGFLRSATFDGSNGTFPLGSSQSHGGGTNNGIVLFDGGVGLEVAGGGNALGSGRLFAFASALTSSSLWASSTGYSSNPLGGPIALRSGVVAPLRGLSSAYQLLRVDYASGSKQALGTTSLVFGGLTAPTLVAGQGGLLYLLDSSGTLAIAPQAFSDGVAAPVWSTPLPPGMASSVSASPTLSCNLHRTASTTGVLAFATQSGWLVTYLVDSKGLDTTAPWPKYGHDVRNTNNPATPIEACP